MKPAHRKFALAYLANRCSNAADAYCKAYPATSREAAWVSAHRLLRDAKVAAFIDAEWQKHLAKQKLDADAVIGMVVCEAKADITKLFDEDNNLLPLVQWPKEMTHCVEALEGKKVKLASPSAARKLLLELSGRTRSVADSIDHMAEAILADRAKHLKKEPLP